MAQKISYNPGTSAITSDNPLTFMDDSSPEAVCDDNARILAGLLKSIGLPDVTIKFSWGGEESTDKFNYFCVNGGCPGAGTNLVNKSSMQVSRPQLGKPGGPEDLESNPTFLYHATVDYNSKSYDPSYGIVDNGIQLLTAMKIESGQSPTCVHDAAATALLVARNALRDRNPAINNNTNIVCSLRSQSRTADVRSFRFEETSSAAQKSTFNQSDGKWNIQDQFGEIRTIQGFTKGAWVSELTAGDFDGDGLIDPAVWETSGDFGYISSYYPSQVFSFTLRPREVDEKLVPGDYDGDGRADVAVWRGSDGRFTYWKSSNNQEEVVTYWGGTAYGDVPAPGDYDGDGKTDIAIYRTSDGNWWIIRSSNGSSYFLNWGIATDIPVPADYDGDGKTDLAVVRPSEGVWYTLESGNNNAYRGYSGPTLGTNDQPVPADYDGDGRIDFAVWFPATGEWSIGDGKTLATRIEYFGRDSGVPVASMNVFRP